ncbi:MAG: hypothetical protein RLZZ297_1270 [Chloroflexota bacterium]|jgi:hypothetical protein
MAVLCEGLSVVIRRPAIATRYIGGFDAFLAALPDPQTLCMDDHLVRVGFLAARAVKTYTDTLVAHGLVFIAADRFVDMAVVDMQGGVTMACPWLQYARIPGPDGVGRLPVCWYAAGGIALAADSSPLACPPGWVYDGSLSQAFRAMPGRL